MRHLPARTRLDSRPLTPERIRKIVLPLFRRRHAYGTEDGVELVLQLAALEVTNSKQLRIIMKRHRRALLQDENRRMSRLETRWIAEETGGVGIDVHSSTSWFTIAGLARQAMELEFGERAAALWTATED